MDGWMETLGMIGGLAMPLFNIPLVYNIWKRKSSEGLSLTWALGIWVCIILMTPQAVNSPDTAFKMFGIANVTFFTVVIIFILKYRRPAAPDNRGR